MSRLTPLKVEELADFDAVFAPVLKRLGFVPTSQRVMTHRPKIVRAFNALTAAIRDPEDSTVSNPLKDLVALMASKSAGCMYCTAHSAAAAGRNGIEDAKVAAVWEYETSPLFSDAERAALRFAQAAAQVPNAVTDDDIDALKAHFDEGQIVELMAVVAIFGFLNRWNDSLATPLEEEPWQIGDRVLAGTGWTPGKHAA